MLELTWPPSFSTPHKTWVGLIRMFLSPDYLHSNYFTQLFLVWILIWNGNISIYNTCTPLENKKEEREKKKVLFGRTRSVVRICFLFYFSTKPRLGSGQPTPFSCLFSGKEKWTFLGDLPTHTNTVERSRDTQKLSIRFHFSLSSFFVLFFISSRNNFGHSQKNGCVK